jgi:hypothetical protein
VRDSTWDCIIHHRNKKSSPYHPKHLFNPGFKASKTFNSAKSVPFAFSALSLLAFGATIIEPVIGAEVAAGLAAGVLGGLTGGG